MSHQLITHQNIGDEFSSVYYVESACIRQTVTKKDYTDMVLRDRSGSRPVKYWGTIKNLSKGCWVFVSARVEEYMGSPSFIAKNVEIEDEPEELSNYIPIYEGSEELADDFDSLRSQLGEIEERTGDETCSMMVDEVYRSGTFFDKFVRCPGSDGPCYGKKGGLLASVVRVGKHAIEAAKHYNLADQEKAVMLAASLLCRVGATDAYEFENCMPILTKRGIMLGVPNLTMTRVSSALRRVVGYAKKEGKVVEQETVLRVLHSIVAANETCGVQSMTKEAMVLQGIVNLDSDVVDALDFIDNDVNEDDEFTAFDPKIRRRYFKG